MNVKRQSAQWEARTLERILRRMYQRYTAGSGYQPWGFDLRTFRSLRPVQAYLYMRAYRRLAELQAGA